MTTMLVTLTVEQLRDLIREELKAAVRELEDAPPTTAPPTKEELAKARRSLRRFGRGA